MSIETLMGIYLGVVPTSVVNQYSAGGRNDAVPVGGGAGWGGPAEILSGALTAGTFKSVLSYTGKGWVSFLSAYSKDSTARSISFRVTVDSVVIFNTTTSGLTSAGRGLVAIGSVSPPDGNATTVLAVPDKFVFNTSLLVEVASTLSETDKVGVGAIWGGRA